MGQNTVNTFEISLCKTIREHIRKKKNVDFQPLAMTLYLCASICVRICVCMCLYAQVFVCAGVCVWKFLYVRVFACACVCICARLSCWPL